MFFNQLMTIGEIISAYKTNTFPNAYCLLTNNLKVDRVLTTENDVVISTEDGKAVETDGSTELIVN